MASYAIASTERAVHEKTLTASTVDTVTITGYSPVIEVVNHDGADQIYFTLDGSTPTAKGASTYVVPATICSREADVGLAASGSTLTVKLISDGTPLYSVLRVP